MYNFPIINNLSDVEKHIDEKYFRTASKEGVLYVNYKSMNPDTFPPVVDYATAVRREFRGIAFDEKSGEVLSRPFHKFFNVGERPDEEFTDDYHLEEKLDGSMVRPILHPNGALRLATKAGVTDVSMLAEEYVSENMPEIIDYMTWWVKCGLTPIFEFTSPNNRIVLDYDEPKLTLLALRFNRSGCYANYPILQLYSDTHVQKYDAKMEDVDGRENEEGCVVVHSSGHRMKAKTDWYVKRHKAKELFDREHVFVQKVLSEEIDDIYPKLDEAGKIRCNAAIVQLEHSILEEISEIENSVRALILLGLTEKKQLALDLPDSPYKTFYFKCFDEKFDEDYYRDYVLKQAGSAKKWKEFKEKFDFGFSLEEVTP